eukprot:15379127-Alexandrium_andersonii.AAC.1
MSRKASEGVARRSARRCRKSSKNPGSTWLMRSASKVDVPSRPRNFSEKVLVRFIKELAGLRSRRGQPAHTTAARMSGGSARMKLRQSSSTVRVSGSWSKKKSSRSRSGNWT